VLEFVRWFGQFGIVAMMFFNNGGRDQFLQVMHRATYWIHMWSFLLPEDQREFMDIECTRLMAVVRAMFNWVANDILIGYMMHSVSMYFIFRWLIHIATLCDPWKMQFKLLHDTTLVLIKWSCASLWYSGWAPVSKKCGFSIIRLF
jgi:hypothetical protein